MLQHDLLVPVLKELYKQGSGDFNKDFNLFAFRDEESSPTGDKLDDVLGFTVGNRCYLGIGTTDPGREATLKPLTVAGITGAARIKEGFQPEVYQIGVHAASKPSFAHDAWIQTGILSIYRDTNKNGKGDESDPVTRGWYGCNRHRASKSKLIEYIGPYSYGCMVYWNAKDLEAELKAFRECPLGKKKGYLNGIMIVRDAEMTRKLVKFIKEGK